MRWKLRYYKSRRFLKYKTIMKSGVERLLSRICIEIRFGHETGHLHLHSPLHIASSSLQLEHGFELFWVRCLGCASSHLDWTHILKRRFFVAFFKRNLNTGKSNLDTKWWASPLVHFFKSNSTEMIRFWSSYSNAIWIKLCAGIGFSHFSNWHFRACESFYFSPKELQK